MNSSSIDELRRACVRLDRHIERLDAGEAGADEDVSVLLRIFLGHGDGNQLIERHLSTFRLRPSTIRISPAPSAITGVVFSIGGLPNLEKEAGKTERTVKFPREFLKKECLFLPGLQGPFHLCWHQLIDHAGNSFGAHYAKKLPEYFGTVSFFGAAGQSIVQFLLRSCAVATSTMVHSMIRVVDQTHASKTHALAVNGLLLTHATYIRNGDNHEMRTQVKPLKEGVDLEMMRVRDAAGGAYIFTWLADRKLRLDVKKPEPRDLVF